MSLRELGPKKRFTILLLLIHAVALPLMAAVSYVILRESAINAAYNSGRLYLATIGSVKHYVAEDLRPLFYREMPGRFIVSGMSRSYIASAVAGRVGKTMPNYRYKNASLNPKNAANAASDFEADIIRTFQADRTLKEWKGFRDLPSGPVYVIALPGDPFTPGCLKCHGDPADAPPELRERYGTSAGFHATAGSLLDAIFVHIPIGVPLADARRMVAVFIGMYSVVGTIILIIIHLRFGRLYDLVSEDRRRMEGINLELIDLNHDMESIIAERTMNLIALSVADRVRNPAAAIAGTIARLLKKEELPAPLREKLLLLLPEAEKLDEIVRGYESILRTRQVRFRMEDLNELLRATLPFVEEEARLREVSITLGLSEAPPRCMAHRQILRVAILHVLRNAIEATPAGGVVSVGTAADQDRVSLVVTDSGRGIPAEEIPKVFSPLFSTKRQRMGMGLSLVKQIVEEHRGDITIANATSGGTVVRLSFPVRWSEQGLSEQPA